MAFAKPTSAQKAVSKNFVKALKVLKKSTKLETKPLAELLGLKAPRLNDWLSGRRTPDEKAQAEVRKAASKSFDRLAAVKEELFALMAVTAPTPCEDPSKD